MEQDQLHIEEQARIVATEVRVRAEGVAQNIIDQAKIIATEKLQTDTKGWGARFLPLNIFTWAMGIIFLVFSIIFALQTQMANRIDKLDTRLTSIQDSQSDIRDTLIRLDERQQVNISNVLKILVKLNIN
jgi:hypothetical protein